MEEQSVGGSREVKLVEHQPADASVDGILQQHRVGALWHAWWREDGEAARETLVRLQTE